MFDSKWIGYKWLWSAALFTPPLCSGKNFSALRGGSRSLAIFIKINTELFHHLLRRYFSLLREIDDRM